MVTKDPVEPGSRRDAARSPRSTASRSARSTLRRCSSRGRSGAPIRSGKIDRAIEVAEEAEIPLVVMHPPYRWQRGYRRWLLERLPTLSERTGVTVALENMFPVRMGQRGVTFHSNQDLDELDGLPNLVLDTSHAAVADHDLVEVRRRFGERVRHVHLSDNAGKGWDSHLPPGDGVLDLDAFLRRSGRRRVRGRRLARGRPASLSDRRFGAALGDGRDARAGRIAAARERLRAAAPGNALRAC